MLLRLDALEHIGRFAKLKHKAEPFTGLTLVFGRNGYGKSTLCAVLRSVSDNDPNHIATRKRLQSTADPRIQTTWGPSQTVSFGNGKWNSSPGKIHVFDQEFVNQNLHVGDSVTRDNKRSLLPVVLGHEGVELADKIVALDREQRDLDLAMRRDGSLIRAQCPIISPDQLSSYCSKDPPEDVEQHVLNAERSVQLARQSVAVQTKKNLSVINLPLIDFFSEVCARTLAVAPTDITQKIREHAQAHALNPPQGDRWLRYGLEHIADNNCPFCAQSLDGVDLIEAYSSYFSTAFNALISDRDQAFSTVEACVKNKTVENVVGANETDFFFWKDVCEFKRIPGLTPEARDTIEQGLQKLLCLLEQKVKNPLASLQFNQDGPAINAAFSIIGAYNEEIRACSVVIEVAKQEAGRADLAKAEKHRDSWIAMAAKRTDPLKSVAHSYTKAEKRRSQIETEKKTAQSNLTTFASRMMVSRQKAINDLLANFGTSFRIIDAKANFRGREPNTEYAISIGSAKVPAGEVSNTEPSFKTVLSTGDKTTLALAFFITQVKADPNLENSVVVFDDPFHSQDMHRQFETTSQIRAISGKTRQTIVLSHDPRFLQMIEKDADHTKTRTFQLLCTDQGDGTICLWSSANELKTLYVRQSEMIREYASHGNLLAGHSYNDVHQAIRPFLEDYIKARFPGRFSMQDQIFSMTEAIKAAGRDDPMFDSVEELFSLNEYTRGNMHGGAQASDPDALRAQAKKVVRIVGRY